MKRRPTADLKSEFCALLQRTAAGRANARPLAHLGAELGLTWRETLRCIEFLRADGVLIGTSRGRPPGAFWPLDDADVESALKPYSRAFYRMSQVYNRLTSHAPSNIVQRVESAVQKELFR